MSTLQYSINKVAGVAGKYLEITDNTNKLIYAFGAGTSAKVEDLGTSSYNFVIIGNLERIMIPISQLNDFAGTPPNGSSYTTDYATLLTFMP